MEQSPLIIAQNHARNAVTAPNPAAARVEHEHAATHFAAAAKGTTNLEAARTLKLLEQHHQKLADLLKFRTAHPIPPNTPATVEQQLPDHAAPPSLQQPREGSPYRSQSHPAPLPQRDITSSIASNLASARGIPSNRQKRSQQSPLAPQLAKPEPPNPQRRSKLIEATYQGRSPQSQKPQTTNSTNSKSIPASLPSTPTIKDSSRRADPAPPRSDEPFQRFYSTFESLFSKLSAPLAFAGLPLNPDADASSSVHIAPNANPPQTPASQNDRPHSSRPSSSSSSRRALEASQRVSADPDYKNLFSRAALRAVADEHGPGSVGANESFYVVPTSGHTLAYADILARQHRERRRDHDSQTRRSGDNSDDGEFEGDEELFVDARETPGPPSSPEMVRRRGNKSKAVANVGTKTMEELQLENEAMKALLDQTARRLLEFEMSAQTSSVALARSIRHLNMQNNEGSGAGGSGNGIGSKEAEEKLRAMEEQMLTRVKEMAKVERENEKLKGVVGRYRERFETIKAGARARRDERGKSTEETV
ncbi:MAG: hypothetical protein Q9168_003630 [Polycauliona sp. 1 TL-2023]